MGVQTFIKEYSMRSVFLHFIPIGCNVFVCVCVVRVKNRRQNIQKSLLKYLLLQVNDTNVSTACFSRKFFKQQRFEANGFDCWQSNSWWWIRKLLPKFYMFVHKICCRYLMWRNSSNIKTWNYDKCLQELILKSKHAESYSKSNL